MSAVNRERVKELLSQAARIPPHERAEFVRRTARDDPVTAAEALDLLDTLDDSVFLNAPTGGGLLAALPGADSIGETPGSCIDRYKLLQLIGEGGFGSVFMAEQTEPVHRRVALKIIKAGMDTRQVIARFEAERQALALMDHPGIARVLDAGATRGGRPYFVMELVRGEPITKYCDRERLSVAQRLRLFCGVCHAVQHAHQKGIIHRDLKPSNVLVTVADGQPRPKVIDFGIAKAMAAKLTDKTLFTELHQLIGTPEYMSPEQAEVSGVDIDTRSDVYSLGVLLYELMAGCTPLDRGRLRATPVAEIQRLIREQEPPRPSLRFKMIEDSLPDRKHSSRQPEQEGARPSTAVEIARCRRTEPMALSRLLRGDLDWIVLKCLEKDRRRRYESASAVAQDIERFLAHEPVVATPPRPGYKLRKFIQRNRTTVLAGGLVAAVLIVGTIGTGLGLLWALQEQTRAGEQKKIAESNATAARLEAERANREFESARTARALAEARADETRQVAEFQADMLRGLDAEALGKGIEEGFREALRDALDRRGVGEWPERRPRNAMEVDQVLSTFEQQLDLIPAADVARKVLDTFVLARAVQAASEQFRDQGLVRAQIHEALGASYRALGMFATAEAQYREALTLRELELGEDHPMVALDLNNVATMLYNRGEVADAEPLCRRALIIQRARYGDEHPELVRTLHNLGCVSHARGDREAALRYYGEALAMGRKLHGEEHIDVADTLNNLGGVMFDQGDMIRAEAMFRDALALRKNLLGEGHPDVAFTTHNLASVLGQVGKVEEAEQLHRQALAIRRKRLGSRHPNVSQSLNSLGFLLKAKGEFDEAEALYRECLAIRRDAFGDDNVDVAGTLNNLAVLQRDRGDYASAEPLYREAISILERKLPPGHAQTASARTGLARVIIKQVQSQSLSDADRGPLAEQDQEASAKKDREPWADMDREARLVEAETLLLAAERALFADVTAPPVFKKRVLEGLIELYEWRAAEQDVNDHNAGLDELRARLSRAGQKP